MPLLQTVTEPLVQKSIHHPFLLDHFIDIQGTVGSRLQLLHLNHARIMVNLQMQVRFEQHLLSLDKAIRQPQHGSVFTALGD